jgi:hypothetical protein
MANPPNKLRTPINLNELTIESLLPSELVPLAKPLGELAIAWNLMEAEVNRFLVSVTDNYNTDVADIVFPGLDFREKIKSLKNCAYMEHPTMNWFKLEKELNEIDNTHRTERNRFTHDHLIVEHGHAWRITMKLRLVRPRSRELQLQYRTQSTITAHQVRKRTWAILKSTDDLRKLRKEFEQLKPRTQRSQPPTGHP